MAAGNSTTVSGLSLRRWRQAARTAAAAAAVPLEEVDWLLQATSDLDRLTLQLESFAAYPAIALSMPLAELARLWERRVRERVPVQYLAGEVPWRDLLLGVSPAVLVPRPETELLVEMALAAAKANPALAGGLWADLGTGSGAIAIALARALPEIEVYAIDVSEAALEVARANAARWQVEDRIRWACGSWFSPLFDAGCLSGIVANPPYIPTAEIPSLQPEVARHEPHLALDGGPDGLGSVRELVAVAPDFLQPGGFWAVELGQGQAPTVIELLQTCGSYERIESRSDLAGIARFVLAYRS